MGADTTESLFFSSILYGLRALIALNLICYAFCQNFSYFGFDLIKFFT